MTSIIQNHMPFWTGEQWKLLSFHHIWIILATKSGQFYIQTVFGTDKTMLPLCSLSMSKSANVRKDNKKGWSPQMDMWPSTEEAARSARGVPTAASPLQHEVGWWGWWILWCAGHHCDCVHAGDRAQSGHSLHGCDGDKSRSRYLAPGEDIFKMKDEGRFEAHLVLPSLGISHPVRTSYQVCHLPSLHGELYAVK